MLNILHDYRKLVVAALIMGGVSGISIYHAQAAIPVIDTANIAKQAETLAETIKIVTNTAAQIAQEAKELAGLPETVLNNQKAGIDQGITILKKATTGKDGFFPEAGVLEGVLNSTLPKTTIGDLPQTVTSERANDTTINENLSKSNQETLKSYKLLMDELDAASKRLADLLEQNKNPEGSKQVLQIANAIAAERAHIDSIVASLNALDARHNVLKHQAEIVKAENHKNTVKASEQAETNTIKQMDTDLGSDAEGTFVNGFNSSGSTWFN
jgi:hypothetical protein